MAPARVAPFLQVLVLEARRTGAAALSSWPAFQALRDSGPPGGRPVRGPAQSAWHVLFSCPGAVHLQAREAPDA